MEDNKYTQKEITSNINELTDLMELKKKERTELSQNINSLKKQIKEWEELDKAQLKLF